MNTNLTRHQWIAFGAALATFVGALLPWATLTTGFGTASKAGTEGDGIITMIVGVAGGLAAYRAGRWLWVTFLAGALVTLVGVVDGADIADSELSVGSGLFLTIAAGIVMTVVALMGLGVTRPKRADWSPPAVEG